MELKTKEFKYNLGDMVTDRVTGFTGIVNSRSQWLNGCNTYGVKSRELKDGQPADPHHFDELQLKIHTRNALSDQGNTTGGPINAAPQPNRM